MNRSAEFFGDAPLRDSERLDELAAAIRRIEEGWTPNPEELHAMPLVRGWSFSRVPTLVITGRVYGHPRIDDGKSVVTSALLAMDRESGWARTHNRFYRLGPAAIKGLV